ncbi:hypothetical protein ACFVTY_04260 [Streptomyces sp. NPDC058067]
MVKAVRKVMLGAAHPRCRVHPLRKVFAVISKNSGDRSCVSGAAPGDT